MYLIQPLKRHHRNNVHNSLFQFENYWFSTFYPISAPPTSLQNIILFLKISQWILLNHQNPRQVRSAATFLQDVLRNYFKPQICWRQERGKSWSSPTVSQQSQPHSQLCPGHPDIAAPGQCTHIWDIHV